MGLFEAALNTSAFGVVAWLVFHTFSKTLPEIISDFRAELRVKREEYRTEITRQRDDFRAELENQRACFTAAIDKLSRVMDELVQTMADRPLSKECRYESRCLPDGVSGNLHSGNHSTSETGPGHRSADRGRATSMEHPRVHPVDRAWATFAKEPDWTD